MISSLLVRNAIFVRDVTDQLARFERLFSQTRETIRSRSRSPAADRRNHAPRMNWFRKWLLAIHTLFHKG